MRILIDSHVVVWWLAAPDKLSAKARSLIADPANELSVSAASIWELQLKIDKGQLQMPKDYADHLWGEGFGELPVRARHVSGLSSLPGIHKDPFDRILIAQAIIDGMHLMTSDRQIHRYPAPLLSC